MSLFHWKTLDLIQPEMTFWHTTHLILALLMNGSL